MVQVQYSCLYCYSSHHCYLICPTSRNEVAPDTNFIDSSSRYHHRFKFSSMLLIMDIFIKFYYLLFQKIQSTMKYLCHFLRYLRITLNRMNWCYIKATKDNKTKEFLFQNMQKYNNTNKEEIVKVKYQTKCDRTLSRHHKSNISHISRSQQHCKQTSTFFLILLVFINFLSTTHSVTGKKRQYYNFHFYVFTTTTTASTKPM